MEYYLIGGCSFVQFMISIWSILDRDRANRQCARLLEDLAQTKNLLHHEREAGMIARQRIKTMEALETRRIERSKERASGSPNRDEKGRFIGHGKDEK